MCRVGTPAGRFVPARRRRTALLAVIAKVPSERVGATNDAWVFGAVSDPVSVDTPGKESDEDTTDT
jgi:hypothetical protein